MRHPDVQIGGVTEKIVMEPDLGLLQAGGSAATAVGTVEKIVVLEIDVDIEALFNFGEIYSGNLPRNGKAKSR